MLVRTILTSLCVFALALSGPAGADDNDSRRNHRDGKRFKFEPLSINHILYGVSQFSHGAVSDAPVPIKLSNANLVTQAAATLIYARGKSDESAPTLLGAFAGCFVKVLPPRSALGISQIEVPLVPPNSAKAPSGDMRK